MLWGCFAAGGTGALHKTDSIMRVDVLKQHLKTSVRKLKLGCKWVFQMDYDPKHTSTARSVSVDLNNDASLLIDIPDALCERDKVKFTVHTKTTLSSFQKPDFSVPRQHEDFIWLHDALVETEDYAGLIIPPAPPKPDFESPREKMHKLGEGEATMTKEEYTKMKQELEAEYLAVFKKTVQVHEVFLQRLSSHPILSKDRNFQIFLEYDQDLSVRRKNAKETFGSFFKNMVKSADEVIISGIKEVDDFFEQEKTFLLDYSSKIKDSTARAEKMTRSHKNVADDYIHISATLNSLSVDDNTDLLYRRARALADYENSNKALDKARLKSKDITQAEEHQQQCLQKFDKLSESGKRELTSFKGRRVVAFRKNLIEMSELEIKHAKNNMALLQGCIELLKSN
uniref:Sorting nexin n=1 Tax=Oncorhynchus mykiss TaxID=8022 RepID=A0A8C7QJK7_ONCMY